MFSQHNFCSMSVSSWHLLKELYTWTDGPVNVLGVVIPEKQKIDICTINFNNKVAKIDKILQPWRGKALTLSGKISLVNSLVVSQFTYISLCHFRLHHSP